jgi:uncharacterized protein (TIGR00251 family)
MSEERIALHVIPKSSADRIEGWVVDAAGEKRLKVRLRATPEDGKANKALIKLLAKEWNLPQSSLEVVSGTKNRYKIVKILK